MSRYHLGFLALLLLNFAIKLNCMQQANFLNMMRISKSRHIIRRSSIGDVVNQFNEDHSERSKLRELRTEDLLGKEQDHDGLDIAEQILNHKFHFEFAPPMTVEKYETMQSRRVEVTIKYAGFAGYELYSNATERMIKTQFPDVVIKRVVYPVDGPRSEGAFDLLVDDQVVYSKRRDRVSVFLQMGIIRETIRKKRIERRKGKFVYGEPSTYRIQDDYTDDQKSELNFGEIENKN